MATKPRSVIQKESDERRNVKMIGFKVPESFADKLSELSGATGKSKTKIVMESVEKWEKSLFSHR